MIGQSAHERESASLQEYIGLHIVVGERVPRPLQIYLSLLKAFVKAIVRRIEIQTVRFRGSARKCWCVLIFLDPGIMLGQTSCLLLFVALINFDDLRISDYCHLLGMEVVELPDLRPGHFRRAFFFSAGQKKAA